MKEDSKSAQDTRFHYKIYDGPSKDYLKREPPISYVENYNGHCGYAELATDFKMAADLMIEQSKRIGLGNLTAPVSHLVRQTLELKLKALLETTLVRGSKEKASLLYKHNLQDIWKSSKDWLISSGYKIREDARFDIAEWMILSFHAIDPSGDLFRFGISKQTAFGKRKSYDRVGINIGLLEPYFNESYAFLSHWEAVPFREMIAKEEGWERDPYFDPDDFPRVNSLREGGGK